MKAEFDYDQKCLLCSATLSMRCDGRPFIFNEQRYEYRLCTSCNTSTLFPLPSPETLKQLYTSTDYHQVFYQDIDNQAYMDSVKYLAPYVRPNAVVLDYGCGTGLFAQASNQFGYKTFYSDIDKSACLPCLPDQNFIGINDLNKYHGTFDIIHIGDVLEHLNNPFKSINSLLPLLKEGGILFIQGPLERHKNLAYFAFSQLRRIRSFFAYKKFAQGTPFHLFRTDSQSQKRFFSNFKELSLISWQVYDDGWPYSRGSLPLRILARTSIITSRMLLKCTLGNRFRAIYKFSSGLQVRPDSIASRRD